MAIFNTKTRILSLSSSIHDLLISKGLQADLLPREVRSYTLSEDGYLEVFLDGPCLTKYENRVFFESVVRANLTYRSLTGVVGLSQEERFLWLPVIDITQLSLSLFEDPPYCKPQGIAFL
ncbi:hypothetical protein SADUNF_Sadunf13G0056700 [Salix dunnii]|uniref:Uncharacterized protein n=1 Tax=Salix dunnii TaxID=1413687 RepID=A0A835MLR6_9ROSI|nr:hypothetical protein SADUNF_Sadunf13G0056700 [Salix dunnii]